MKSKSQTKRETIQCGYLLYNLDPLKEVVAAILCLDCGWTRVSMHRHDYCTCPCPNRAMIDGGRDYTRFGAAEMKRVQLLQVKPFPDDVKKTKKKSK